MLLILLALLVPQDSRDLVERLRSDEVEEREEAARLLREMGRPALAELQKASRDPDPEVAGRARRLVRMIHGTENFTPALLESFPGIEERLASGTDHDWTLAFLAAANLKNEDVQPMAARALRGAETPREKSEVCRQVRDHGCFDATPGIVELLKDPDPAILVPAVECLRTLKARESVTPTVVLLKHPEGRVRIQALDLLPFLEDSHCIPAVTKLLGDREGGVRGIAVSALARLEGKAAMPKLLLVLRLDPAPWVRLQAALAVMQIAGREGSDAIAGLLRDREASVRVEALKLLQSLEARESEKEIVGRLSDSDPKVREAAITVVTSLFLSSGGPGLVRLLADDVASLRSHAAWAVGELRIMESVPALRGLLSDQSCAANAVASLGRLGAREAASDLCRLLDDPALREACVTALGDLGIREAAPKIVRLLHEGRIVDRINACTVLGELGAKEAGPEILRLLDDPDENVARAAIRAAGRLGERRAVPRMRAFLSNPDCRSAALLALAELRAMDPDFPLVAFLENRDLHSEVLWTLARIKDWDAVPHILALLRNGEGIRREEAAEALGFMGAREVGPDLIKLFESGPCEIRATVALALGDMRFTEAIPALAAAVAGGGDLAFAAAEALGNLDAQDQIPAFRKLLSDSDPAIRIGAATALTQLGSKDGVPVLLAQGTNLEVLNVLRQGETWRRLRRIRIAPDRRVHRLVKTLGLNIRMLRPPTENDLLLSSFMEVVEVPARIRATQALYALSAGPCEIVLEPDQIRLVSHEEALKLWREWWERGP